MTTRERKLKRGLHVVVYDDPVTKTGDQTIGVLHSFNAHHSNTFYPDGPGGHCRNLESWSVRFSASDPIVDRWVSIDDLQD